MSISFARQASVTASTKRRSDPRSAPTTHLSSVAIVPLTPADPKIAFRLGIETPYEMLQTFTEEADIQEGDYLVIGSAEYPVKAVGDYPWRPTGGKRLVVLVEELKNQ